jgi:hypothetical protein
MSCSCYLELLPIFTMVIDLCGLLILLMSGSQHANLLCNYAQLDSTCQCSRINFRIPIVFDMFPIELVRF